MDATRRALLGAAALGASGLALMQNAAQAEATDRGNPGEGGFARNAVQLPPGAKVAEHDPKDIEAMPNFKFSLDGGIPKITSGGWAKESTIHQLPVSKGIAGVHMFLNPGASRELHWHAIAAEWAFLIDGRCQTVVVEPSGASEINNFEPGDLGISPRATVIRSNVSATSLATSYCRSTTGRSPSTVRFRSPIGLT
jgi:oxalate decarboxylase